MGGFRTTTTGKGEGSSRWEVKEAKDSGKGRKESGKRGGWKGDGKWWPDEDKGRKEGKHGKGKNKKGDEWQGKARDWSSRDRAGNGGEESGEAKESRSQLSSNAPDFQPSGMYDYDALAAQYWSWQPFLQEMPPLWREYADKDGTKYYYNAKTGLTQWERPAELDSSPADGTGGSTSSTGGHASKNKDSGVPGPWRDRENDREELKKLRSDEGKEGKGKRDRRRAGKSDANSSKEPSFGPPGCNLFVFHLPDDWTDDDLLEYFAPHGNVVSAKVMKELGTGRSRGFGFVSYEDRVSAATAIKKMQGYKILGKRLKVEFKKGEGDNGKGEAEKIDLIEEKSSGDDERLIGYLRAISAKSVVQSLKESEKAAEADEEGQPLDDFGD